MESSHTNAVLFPQYAKCGNCTQEIFYKILCECRFWIRFKFSTLKTKEPKTLHTNTPLLCWYARTRSRWELPYSAEWEAVLCSKKTRVLHFWTAYAHNGVQSIELCTLKIISQDFACANIRLVLVWSTSKCSSSFLKSINRQNFKRPNKLQNANEFELNYKI